MIGRGSTKYWLLGMMCGDEGRASCFRFGGEMVIELMLIASRVLQRYWVRDGAWRSDEDVAVVD